MTKEFYKELQAWYFYALDKIRFPEDYKYSDDPQKNREVRNATNLIRLLTRVIFAWFMRERNLIPEDIFDENKLKGIVKDFLKDENSSNYYNAILQNLFFATLNQKPSERAFASDGGEPYNPHYGVKTLYRYADKFLISKEDILKLFKNVPFLNGGLFDCLDKEDYYDEKKRVIYIDGFSRNPKKRAVIPDYLFFNKNEIIADLSQYGLGKNEKVRGLFTIFRDYNWTTDEASPVDEEIALDPELLGKVFENLLASYNPETHETARRATGSYYTPREIVDFMVDTTLVEYLKNKCPEVDEEKIKLLLSYSEEIPTFSEEERAKLLEAIDNAKIIDTACGSGAFLMGALHKLVHILERLDPDNKHWKELQRRKIREDINHVFESHETDEEIKQALKELNEIFDESLNYPNYSRKLYLIENCIYGVDIQPIAVQISKLRFFISLILDQMIDPTKENLGIRPLPNLETKFVAANTLIGLQKQGQITLAWNIERYKEELRNLRHKYFTAKTRTRKIQLQQKDRDLREQIKKELLALKFSEEDAEKIASFDPFDQNSSADWFDPEWMFGVKDGFDLVIGNPPYIQLQKAIEEKKKYADLYKSQGFETFDRMGDIYCLFYEKGMQILKENGILTFITSNKWMRAGYGEKLRAFFLKYNPKVLIDLGPGVFESATVDTCILMIQKRPNENKLKAVTVTGENIRKGDLMNLLETQSVVLAQLTKDVWFIASDIEKRIKEKIEQVGRPLKEWDINIYYGIKTGLNEAFIISTEKRNEILKACKTEEERQRTEELIRPVLRGRDIKRYYYEWAGLWIIATFPARKLDIDNYPALKNYFVSHFDIRQLEQSGKRYPQLGFNARKKTSNKWFETQDQISYYIEFEKEKLIYSEIVREPSFCWDTEKFYIEATGFLMTGWNTKFLCGLLNSIPASYFFKKWYAGGGLGSDGYRYKKAFLENLPIPVLTSSNKQTIELHIEELFDEITKTKKNNHQADTTKLEREINQLVYRLYELSDEEIGYIEKDVNRH
ncbi:N-6 DNA methylase [Fervidobacterium sp. 2310opik-2]|uniref:Eco57I restriction-modification methylase domain-containing protein n=1 Tax=Fervidobacterium sp. 2310opik-2 TaxID=1755815 RepID=UPI0016A27819|nr:N-6 DNA methylase [Fervidobacterium sp. 2310opik-2]KAF2961346.1 hypothetical protein AS161_09045 [Fervidobacterium sp. 2310opik-2]